MLAGAIEAWAPLTRRAERIVADCHVPWPLREDYRQEALLAAVGAARDWDPAAGVPFMAYCSQRMRWAVLSVMRAADPLPATTRRAARAVAAAEEALAARGESRSDVLLARETGLPALTVRRVQGWASRAEHEFAQQQSWGAADAARHADEMARVRNALQHLSDREREALEQRYLQGQQVTVMARDWGVTPGRVTQVVQQALQRVRRHLA